MSAHIIVHIDLKNLADLAPYQELALPTMKEFGIRLVKKSPNPQMLEGNPVGSLSVLLEADSAEVARAWYSSPTYAKAIEARKDVATFTTVLLE